MYRALPMALTAAAAALLLASSSVGGQPAPAFGPSRAVRFLALGDSYTIGESVAQQDRWPMLLANLLIDHGYATEVSIIARTGWTTDELWSGIQSGGLSPPYDLVSLLIGVNNQYRGLDLDEYRVGFRLLLGNAIDYAGGDSGRVLVLSIPDWGVTPFAEGREPGKVAREIDQFNAVNLEESRGAGVQYVDITGESRTDALELTFIAKDGLHPSGRMYAAWAELALPAALAALSR
jgi:lysophospholipase L1-like esterase